MNSIRHVRFTQNTFGLSVRVYMQEDEAVRKALMQHVEQYEGVFCFVLIGYLIIT